MLDNWTVNDLFASVYLNGDSMDDTAGESGRVAIIDDPEVEKLWDQYVQARQQLLLKYYTWIDQGNHERFQENYS